MSAAQPYSEEQPPAHLCCNTDSCFEVWQFHRSYRVHCVFLACASTLAAVVTLTTDVEPLIVLACGFATLLLVLRVLARHGRNQLECWQYSKNCFFLLLLVFQIAAVFERLTPPPNLDVWLEWLCVDCTHLLVITFLATNLPMPPRQYFILLGLCVPMLMQTPAALRTFDGFATGDAPLIIALVLAASTVLDFSIYYNWSAQSRLLFTSIQEQRLAHKRQLDAERRAHARERIAHEREIRIQEELMHHRDRHLGALSHDFGTPIAALSVAVQLFQQRVSESDVVAPLLRSITSSLELLQVVRNRAIAFAKLRNGVELKPHAVPFEVTQFLRKIEAVAQVMAKDSRVTACFAAGAGVPESIEADEGWLFMIVCNLLVNAFKFTSEGCVCLTIRKLQPGSLRFEVSDTGEGVPAELEQHLFKPFHTAALSWTSGSGLGLYHVNQLATAASGQAGYRRNVPVGSIFYVDMPVPECAAPAGAGGDADGRKSYAAAEGACGPLIQFTPSPAETVVDSSARLKELLQMGQILVVDDSPMIRMAMSIQLETWGARQVAQAENGRIALDRITVQGACACTAPYWVFMDVLMPGMDGFGATRAIRKWEASREQERICIIGLSANGNDEACRRDGFAAGMDAMLVKPVDRDTMLNCLSELHSRRQRNGGKLLRA